MKKHLTELFDRATPEELDAVLKNIEAEPLPADTLARVRARTAEATKLPPKKARRLPFRLKPLAAACLALVLLLSTGSYAVAAEAREYNEAARFFAQNALPAEGLTRREIKAVYRDIVTESFTYDKTATVIGESLQSTAVSGILLTMEDPTAEEVRWFWDYKNGAVSSEHLSDEGENANGRGISYRYSTECELIDGGRYGSIELYEVTVEQYRGEDPIWQVTLNQFYADHCLPLTDGVLTVGWDENRTWVAKIDTEGEILWCRALGNGFRDEYITADALDNGDGTYTLFTRGDYTYNCITRIDGDGKTVRSHKIAMEEALTLAVPFEEGYLVRLSHHTNADSARLVRMDGEGNITDTFHYGDSNSYYYITDMIEYGGKVYLSGYATPRLSDENDSSGGRHEIAPILNYIFDSGKHRITEEELTPIVQDNYTALLLVCDPDTGIPQSFYEAKGALGGELRLDAKGNLIWCAERIASVRFSIATSAFSLIGPTEIHRYTFDTSGTLLSEIATGENGAYMR